jgi:hypothetical protein
MTKQDESNRTGTITVSGNGEVRVKPDSAWINLGVSTRGKSAQMATNANAERMTAVINRLKKLGIPDKDIQTGGLSVSQIMQTEEGPEKGKLIGYMAENQITVRMAVDKASQVFDEGVEAGANQSSSIYFGLQDDTAARYKALELAVKSAREEAQIVAGAAAVRLGGPRNMEIAGDGGGVYLERLKDSRSASTPIFPGLLTISARVTLTLDYLYD